MHNTLRRSFAVRVKGMSTCLLFTFLFALVAVAQTQVSTGDTQVTVTDANGAAVPGGAGKKVGDNLSARNIAPEREAGRATVIEPVDNENAPASQQPPDNQGELKRWGLSLHAGVSIPHGNFNTFFNPGPNFAIDLEYRINRTFSVEGIYGFHRFGGEDFGIVHLDGLTLHQFSGNVKVYGGGSSTRPFFNFGGGAYHFGSGSGTHGGVNIGAGFQHDVTPTIAVEGVYNLHNVFTSGSSTRFSGVQGGVRFRF